MTSVTTGFPSVEVGLIKDEVLLSGFPVRQFHFEENPHLGTTSCPHHKGCQCCSPKAQGQAIIKPPLRREERTQRKLAPSTATLSLSKTNQTPKVMILKWQLAKSLKSYPSRVLNRRTTCQAFLQNPTIIKTVSEPTFFCSKASVPLWLMVEPMTVSQLSCPQADSPVTMDSSILEHLLLRHHQSFHRDALESGRLPWLVKGTWT